MTKERKELIRELTVAAHKVADIIRVADTKRMIPNSEWTVGDAVAHIVISQHYITSFMTGKKNAYIPDPDRFIEDIKKNLSREYVANINKNFLSQFSERKGPQLADALIKEINSLITVGEKYPDDKQFNTHYGQMSVLVLFSYCLLHLLLHGSTVAKTLHKSLPVTVVNTGLTIPFIKLVMTKLFDKNMAGDLDANFVLAMRNVETFVVHVKEGKIKVDTDMPAIIDTKVTFDSLTFFLIANGYISQLKALFTGKLALSGKKPWLALKFPTLFRGL